MAGQLSRRHGQGALWELVGSGWRNSMRETPSMGLHVPDKMEVWGTESLTGFRLELSGRLRYLDDLMNMATACKGVGRARQGWDEQH
jgi:hypothetical protein